MVGVAGFALDVGLFNFLRISTQIDSYSAKVISTVIAVGATFLVNSVWTFRVRELGRRSRAMRFTKYSTVHLLGMPIPLFALFFSREVLGFTSLLADNLSANLVGVAIAFGLRWTLNANWVFKEVPDGGR